MSIKVTLSSIALLLLATACGTLAPLSYKENSPNPGSLIQTIRTKEATISLTFMRSKYNLYVFDLMVTNHTAQTVYLAPQRISFYAAPKAFINPTYEQDADSLSAAYSSLSMKRQFAHAPLAVERIYREKIRKKEAASVLFAVVGAGLVIYDDVKDSQNEQKETSTKKNVNEDNGRELLIGIANTATEMAISSAEQAKGEIDYLRDDLFPECKIAPGASVHGKVFIPIETRYRYARVLIPLFETDYIFDFKRKHVPTKAQFRDYR